MTDYVSSPPDRDARARSQVFAGDQHAIEQARHQLRQEFLRHKDVRDTNELRKFVWMWGGGTCRRIRVDEKNLCVCVCL